VSQEPIVAVIDDDESFRTSLVELLSSIEYAARGFTSAEEFIATDAVTSYGCIITDIHMPGMSGIDLQRLLMSQKCQVPVIMITARADAGVESRVASSGVICLLRKPFEVDTLIGCLEKALGM
jgi:FixJ family two-component response regulator